MMAFVIGAVVSFIWTAAIIHFSRGKGFAQGARGSSGPREMAADELGEHIECGAVRVLRPSAASGSTHCRWHFFSSRRNERGQRLRRYLAVNRVLKM